VLIVILVMFVSPLQDPDFWWHLRTGRWIVENHALPAHDLYTFTVPGHVWTDHEYLTEALMWWLYAAGGPVALSLAFGALTWLGFWILYRRVRQAPFVIAGLGLALGAVAGAPIWGPRAQMITFFLACLELYWIDGYLSGRSRALTWFPIVMAVWANLHGGFVVGFVFLGVALVSEALQWAVDPAAPAPRQHLKRLGLITAGSALAVLATPHVLSLYLYPFQTQGSVAQQKLIVEWFSPDFHQTFLKPFEAMVLLLFTGFALQRPRLLDLLLSLTAVFMALQSVRHIALYVAACTPILVTTWTGVWRRAEARWAWRSRLEPRKLFAAVTALMLLLIAGVTLVRIASELGRQETLDRATYPVLAAQWLAEHPEIGARMYNQYGWGGYLAYRFYGVPDRQVFIFGEAALMGDDLLNRYQDVQTLRPNWQQVLDDYQVDYVLYNRGEALANVLAIDPAWKLAYQDEVAVIYVRAR